MSNVEVDEISLEAIVLDLLMVNLDYLTMDFSERRKKLMRFNLLNKFFSFLEEKPLIEKFKLCNEYLIDKVFDLEESIQVLKQHGHYCFL